MQWQLGLELKEEFSTKHLELPEGTVFIPKRPIEFANAIRPIPENDEELSYVEKESFLDVVLDYPPPYKEDLAIDFEWQGVMLSGHSLRLYDLGQDPVLIKFDFDEEPDRLIAALEPTENVAVFSAFFQDFIKSNGENYGVDVFGSLPTMTTNYVESLVPRDVVMSSYYDWMECYEQTFDTWTKLYDYLDYLERSAEDVLPDLMGEIRHQLKNLTEKKAGHDFSSEEKHSIFDEYFRRSYKSRRPRK